MDDRDTAAETEMELVRVGLTVMVPSFRDDVDDTAGDIESVNDAEGERELNADSDSEALGKGERESADDDDSEALGNGERESSVDADSETLADGERE